MSDHYQTNAYEADLPTYLIDPRLFEPHAAGPAKHLPSAPQAPPPQGQPPTAPSRSASTLPLIADVIPHSALDYSSAPITGPTNPPFSTSSSLNSQVRQATSMSNLPVVPLSAAHSPYSSPYNFRPLPLVPTPLPYTPPHPASAQQHTPINTTPPKNHKNRTPLSKLSLEEKQARQDLLASCYSDRQIFLNLLKEPDNGGLNPKRLAVLDKVFRHRTMSSIPASVAGIEANKKARWEGLVEIAMLRAKMAKSLTEEIDATGEAESHADGSDGSGNHTASDEMETETGTEKDATVTDGITLSYFLNGRPCTREDLEGDRSRFPYRAISQAIERTPGDAASAALHEFCIVAQDGALATPPSTQSQLSVEQQLIELCRLVYAEVRHYE